MSTLLENLEKLETAKNDIAEAIRDKFVKVADSDGFEEFPELISKIGEPIDPSDLTYEQIAQIVRSGKAEEVFKIGDQIITTYTDTSGTQYEMPWDIVAFRDATLENGLTVPGMVIQSHYATVERIQFDAPEPSSSAEEYVQELGWNRWAYSGIRQWLNSAANKGEWWTKAHSADVAPEQLNTYNGFMKGLPTDFLNMLKPTKHETALNYKYPAGTSTTYIYDTTYDTFFLPSLKEEHFCYTSSPKNWDSSNKEGSTWEYWIQRKGETPQEYDSNYANVYTNAKRYSLADKSTATYVWLRSAMRYDPSVVFRMTSRGCLNSYFAMDYYWCAPAAIIC